MFRGAHLICNDANTGCVDGLKGRIARSPTVSGDERTELEGVGLYDDGRMVGRREVMDVKVLMLG